VHLTFIFALNLDVLSEKMRRYTGVFLAFSSEERSKVG
jgi:hypothetical protein